VTATPSRPRRATPLIGLAVAIAAFVVYWWTGSTFDALRPDFFALAAAFLRGETWITAIPGAFDVIYGSDGHIYVPFAPFPAIALMPVVAVIGEQTAAAWEDAINAGLAAFGLLLAWWVAGRIGVERIRDRLALVLLLGFGTMMWWVTVRGGVWHTGHLVAIILAMLMLAELFGRQRALLLGLLIGMSFLTRAPTAFVTPAIALWYLWVTPRGPVSDRSVGGWIRALPWRQWVLLGVGLVPGLVVFFGYNQLRFGSPLESGYALATLPDWLQLQRDKGLFSLAHIPMNLDYLLFHLPIRSSLWPGWAPDGLGLSILLTSPGLLLFLRAPWRDRRSWVLLAAAILILIPTLLYYGGGWFQFGYRYVLDSIPFIWALAALGVVARGSIRWWGWALILWGVAMGAYAVWWTNQL
jgi:hypothetical protein